MRRLNFGRFDISQVCFLGRCMSTILIEEAPVLLNDHLDILFISKLIFIIKDLTEKLVITSKHAATIPICNIKVILMLMIANLLIIVHYGPNSICIESDVFDILCEHFLMITLS